jgi:uncharacterized membrane protein YhaH (DUF805 family)
MMNYSFVHWVLVLGFFNVPILAQLAVGGLAWLLTDRGKVAARFWTDHVKSYEAGRRTAPLTTSPLANSAFLAWLLFSFEGRIRRSEFWLYTLGVGLVYALIFVLIGVALALLLPAPLRLYGIIGWWGLNIVAVGWPATAVCSKRLHDRDKSGLWMLLYLIPIVGGIWLLVEMGCLGGDLEPTRFGPPPWSRVRARRGRPDQSIPSGLIATAPERVATAAATQSSARSQLGGSDEQVWQTYHTYDLDVRSAVERLSALSPRVLDEFRRLLLQHRDRARIKEFEDEAIRRALGPAFVDDASLRQTYVQLREEDGRLADEFGRVISILGTPDNLGALVEQIRSTVRAQGEGQKKAKERRDLVSTIMIRSTVGAQGGGQEKAKEPRDRKLVGTVMALPVLFFFAVAIMVLFPNIGTAPALGTVSCVINCSPSTPATAKTLAGIDDWVIPPPTTSLASIFAQPPEPSLAPGMIATQPVMTATQTVSDLLKARLSPQQIWQSMQNSVYGPQIDLARRAGYTDAQIQKYLGLDLRETAPPARSSASAPKPWELDYSKLKPLDPRQQPPDDLVAPPSPPSLASIFATPPAMSEGRLTAPYAAVAALHGRHSARQIWDWLQTSAYAPQIKLARRAGYTDAQIRQYLGLDVRDAKSPAASRATAPNPF